MICKRQGAAGTDIFAGVIYGEEGEETFSVLVKDEDVNLEFRSSLGELLCSVLNDDYSVFIDPEIARCEKSYYAAAEKSEKTRLFFSLDRLQGIRKKFQALNTPKLREVADLVFAPGAEARDCPVSQKLFYYGYFIRDLRFSAQIALIGPLTEEPQLPERPDRETLLRAFDSMCGAYRSSKRSGAVEYSYLLHSVEDLMKCCLFEMAGHEVRIRKCENCGKYFLPGRRSDTVYCANRSPQDAARSCRQYNSEHLWYDRLKQNEVLKLCRNVTSAKQMLVRRNPGNEAYAEDLRRFREDVKQWKADFITGRRSGEEFAAWLTERRGKPKKRP